MTSSSSSPAPDSGRGAAVGPLRGVRVLDLTRFPPGAHCTSVLADLGADVIRLESRNAAGQPSRVVGQIGLARGRRSATLDFRHARAPEVLSRIAGSVDALVENDPPGQLERRGFGYPQASEQHPQLIWCSITGFGQEGPYASWPGHDLTYVAQSGLLGALSRDLPWHPGSTLAVPTGALFAATGILAALRERDATGRGCQIDISLAESATWLLGGMDGALTERPFYIPVDPGRRLYRCGDGEWISVAAAEPRTWNQLCDGLGVPELAEAGVPRAGEEAERVGRRFEEIFATKPAAAWLEALGPRGAAVGPVNTAAAVPRDPQVRARGSVIEVAGVPVPANPVRMRDPQGERSTTATAPPPEVGEHTDQVLAEAGYDPGAIRSLRADGIV